MLLFDLFALFFVSSMLNQNEEEETAQRLSLEGGPITAIRRTLPFSSPNKRDVFKYYSNRKGTKVVEVDADNRCHVFDQGHAEWVLRTRAGKVRTLNYIQYEILLQKCNLDIKEPGLHNAEGKEPDQTMSQPNGGNNETFTEEEFKDEKDLNNDIISKLWDEKNNSTSSSPSQEFDINSNFSMNGTDVSIFMHPTGNDSTTSSGPPIIYPGTVWCGNGDMARSLDDLGPYEGTDKCCREHDHCEDYIPAGQIKHGLLNDGAYTRSNCDCDEKFLTCLDKDRSLSALTSFKIANLYFNLLKPLCFAERHPVHDCHRKRLSGECIRFSYDYQKPKAYQFFPAQPYILRRARSLFDALLYRNSAAPRITPTSIPLPMNVLDNL